VAIVGSGQGAGGQILVAAGGWRQQSGSLSS